MGGRAQKASQNTTPEADRTRTRKAEKITKNRSRE
jgi:hypothetical protein